MFNDKVLIHEEEEEEEEDKKKRKRQRMSCLVASAARGAGQDLLPPLFRREEADAARRIVGQEPIVLAPMVRGSELAFRTLVRRHGVRLCFSPMLTASKLLDGDEGELKLLEECEVGGEGRELVIQLAGSSPEVLYEAAKLCVRSVPGLGALDLNLGCPQTCAKRGGFGAFLLEERPELAGGSRGGLTIALCCCCCYPPTVCGSRDRSVRSLKGLSKTHRETTRRIAQPLACQRWSGAHAKRERGWA